MSQIAESHPAPVARIRDVIELGKPRLSLLVIFTAASGLWLAPAAPPLFSSIVFLLATSGLVAAANTFNCWLEREIDGHMFRTRERPLPAGRLEPRTAFVSGLVLGGASIGALALVTNELTTWLGATAFLSYVLLYTPLKRVTPWALLVGAVPGALPPLMGWTAAVGRLEMPGLFLFGILFFWQLPHFVAISIYLAEDFRRADLRVLPLSYGPRAARGFVLLFGLMLIAFSMLAQPLGLAGGLYSGIALALNLVWLPLLFGALRRDVDDGWARRVFAYSLIYLPLLISTLILTAA